MKQRGSHNEEEKQQRMAKLLGFIVAASLLFTCLEWSSGGPALLDLSFLDDQDVEVDLDLLPPLEKDDRIAAPVHEKEEKIESIRKVDELVVDTDVKLKEEMNFTQVDSDDAEKIEGEKDEVPPLALDFNDNELPERVLEELPEYPGGYSELVRWMTTNLRYPDGARRAKIQGEVVAEFIVEADGSISRLKLIKQASAQLDAEAMRVMKLMPKWKPATKKGRAVRSMIHIPMVFAL